MKTTADRLVDWLVQHRLRVLGLSALLICLAGTRTVLTYSDLRSDLEELLPGTAPAVEALNTLKTRLHGLRHLGVVVDTGGQHNVPAANRFIDDLKARVGKYPEQLVSEVRADISAERRFAETYMLQLMDLEDVQKLRGALEQRRDWEVTRALDMNLLDEQEDPPPPLPIAELRDKYKKRTKIDQSYPNDRLVSSDHKTAVLLIQTGDDGSGRSRDAELLERVKGDIKALGFPDKYAPGMRVGFAADVATRVEELAGLQTDLTLSGGLVLLLVLGVIVWFFRSWRAPVILAVPLCLGTVGAFGLVALPPFNIRHLNSNTAFLGAIVIGNGINSGIILLARFQEEYRRSQELHDALRIALVETWRPTLAAALAASAAYGSLVFTDFRGFNQFGWIGGLGMVTCWTATMLLVPPLVHLLGKGMGRPARASQRSETSEPGLLARLFLARPKAVIAVTLACSFASIVGLAQRTDDWIEYDLSKLRRRDSWVDGERYWGARMDQTLGRYLTPSVVLTENAEQARGVKQRLQQLAEQGKAGDLIANVQTIDSLLPSTRFEAVEEAKQLKQLLTPKLKGQLKPAELALVERALGDEALVPLGPELLPRTLVAGMRENSGRIDRSVLIYPKLGGGTWDAERIQAFADDVRGAARAESPDLKAAGTVLLSSDIARALRHDGPRATVLSLVAVLGICLFAFRDRGRSAAPGSLAGRGWVLAGLAVASLVLGVLLMLGALAWSGGRLNFSNFVALPITFGIAADYSINILKRYQAEGRLEIRRVFTGTGGAVALCSATTIIGFGSLLAAQNRALFSFGVFAVLGEFACLLTAVVVLPAVLLLRERAKRTESAVVQPSH